MRLPIIISLLLLVLSCSDRHVASHHNEVLIPDTTDQFVKIYYEGIENATKELNLNDLKESTDSVEIRVWGLIDIWNRHRLYIIKPTAQDWTCLEYEFINSRPEFENGMDIKTFYTNYVVDTFEVRKCPFQISWKDLAQKLTDQGIYDLPTQMEIPNWENRVSDVHN